MVFWKNLVKSLLWGLPPQTTSHAFPKNSKMHGEKQHPDRLNLHPDGSNVTSSWKMELHGYPTICPTEPLGCGTVCTRTAPQQPTFPAAPDRCQHRECCGPDDKNRCLLLLLQVVIYHLRTTNPCHHHADLLPDGGSTWRPRMTRLTTWPSKWLTWP